MKHLENDNVYHHDERRPPLPALQVVVTRYNMAIQAFRESARIVEEREYQAWLSSRAEIFRLVCLPSMLSQSRPPDAWLIGFDEQARERLSDVLDLIAPHPWIRPVWQRRVGDAHESTTAAFQREIRALVADDHQHLISTRLDSDDALASPHCEAVQQFAAGIAHSRPKLADFWMTFPMGCQLTASDLRLYVFPNNAFLSRCRRLNSGRTAGTALEGNHSRVFQERLAFKATTRWPAWLQYVHGNNIVNSEKTALPILGQPHVELRKFGLDLEGLRHAGRVGRLGAA